MKIIPFISLICLIWFTQFTTAQTETTTYSRIKNQAYISNTDTNSYRKERCVFDLYYPENQKGFSTLIWIHGGGLEGGEKYLPKELTESGFAIASINYRLSPKASYPDYIEDAAEAVAFIFNTIEQYGGDKNKIYVGGHSAGAYLALMIGLDPQYLAPFNTDPIQIKALFPVSGQTLTHYTIKKERNMPQAIPYIDEYAPVYFIRKETSPMLLITGDRELELTARYEENILLYSLLKGIGNTQVELFEMPGFDHGTVLVPAYELIKRYIQTRK